MLHADANGLGNTVRLVLDRLPGDPARARKLYTVFSAALTRATEQAAQAALAPLLRRTLRDGWPEVPFRPLVCAGEDFTAVLDPRFAVQFMLPSPALRTPAMDASAPSTPRRRR